MGAGAARRRPGRPGAGAARRGRAWLRRTPRSTMLLWQGVALAAVLSALGAGPVAGDLPRAGARRRCWRWWSRRWWRCGSRLAGHRVGTSLRSLRKHHREQLDLVTEQRGRLAVLETEQPLAYCVPSLRTSTGRGVAGSAGPARARRARRGARPRTRAPAGPARPGARGVLGAAPGVPAVGVVGVGAARGADAGRGAGRPTAARDAGSSSAGARAGGTGRCAVTLGRARGLGVGPSWSTGSTCSPRRPRPVQAVLVVSLAAVGVVVLPTAFVVVPWLATVYPAG